jgi:hypothetical protein
MEVEVKVAAHHARTDSIHFRYATGLQDGSKCSRKA